MGTLSSDLEAQADSLRQTHISWVFMHPERVFKVKKPVSLGFLDFSTLAQRKQACEAELSFNRRLAPDVYHGLRAVLRRDDGTHHLADSCGPHADAVDWAVEMRRLRDDAAADRRLEAGTLGTEHIERIAGVLADFHQRVAEDSDAEMARRHGNHDAVAENARENFEQTRDYVPELVDAETFETLQRDQMGFLQTHAELIDKRLHEGFVRDGHGDLRLEHVYLQQDGDIQVIDCVEFNDRLRYADVCSDLCFLSMDLRFHGAHRLAEWLLSSYALRTNDYGLYALSDFYESYRAHVRAKVTGITARDPQRDGAARARARTRATAFFELAAACMRGQHGRPVVIAVGGIIASGKSTLAHAIAERLGSPRVEADRTRKHLAGVSAETPLGGAAFDGAYSAAASEATYAEVRRRAGLVLRSGRAVVVDASFRSREQRAALSQLATEHDVPLLFVECQVDPEVCRARLAERNRSSHVSDGREEIFDAFVDSYEPIDELPSASHVVVQTDRPLQDNVDSVLGHIDRLD